VPVLLREDYARRPDGEDYRDIRTLFTIHNIAYQGIFWHWDLPLTGLDWRLFNYRQLEFYGHLNLLKSGIVFGDVITTVSPRYAAEIQTPAYGFGFDGILRDRARDLVGILNGIDTSEWDPSRDRFLPQPYSADDLDGKRAAKAEVLRVYGLPVDAATLARPLVGMVSRMVDQKGLDLIAALVDELPKMDASFAILGTGDARYQDFWRTLAAAHPDRVGAQIGFDEGLAHLIEAGADLFLMPSRFEPSGLNQMYSMRYGTVPVVHSVGGLADTVSTKTGFVFDDYSPEGLGACLRRALQAFRDARKWRTLQRAGMARDFSWDRSAKEYVKIYDRVLKQRT